MNGRELSRVLVYLTEAIEANKDVLCALDGAVGDGDHGVSMTVGMRAARQMLKAQSDPTPSSCFAAISDAFAEEVGASSGVIYEAAFAAVAQALQGRAEITTAGDWDLVFQALATSVQATGRAELNDKTMLDAWLPAAAATRAAAHSGATAPECLTAAVDAAWDGVIRTADLIPKRGRASFLGERARGHRDAGATSAYLMMRALRDATSPAGVRVLPADVPIRWPDAAALRQKLGPWQCSVLVWQAYAPLLALGGALEQALRELAKSRFFQSIEMPAATTAADRKATRALAQQHNWTVMIWASDVQATENLHLGSPEVAIRERSRERFRQLLSEAAEAGATRFGFCSPPAVPESARPAALAVFAEEMTGLAQDAARHGISLVFEGLDTSAHKRGLLGSSAELEQLARHVRATVPGFGLVWDAAHTALNGEELVQSYERLAPHVLIAHFSDAVLDPRHANFGDWHLPIGSGSVLSGESVRAVVAAMRRSHRRDDGPLTLAVEEFSTHYGQRGGDGLARAWSYVAQSLS
jgi:dihydroxyacetone kinase-like protein